MNFHLVWLSLYCLPGFKSPLNNKKKTMTLTYRSIYKLLQVLGLPLLVTGPFAWADSVPGASGSIEITPLVHSSVQLEYNGFVVQVDPWGPVDISHAKTADLILVTDSPGHHLDPEAIGMLSDADTSVVIAENGLGRVPDGIVAINGEILKVAGVTECGDEVKALEGIDVAFMPMNIPVGRMTPQAAADCTKILGPDVVYTYHYNQDWVRRLANPDFGGSTLPSGLSIPETLDAFENELAGSGIEFRRGNWYP